MSEIYTTTLRLNLDSEDDRRAYEYLRQMDRTRYKSYSAAIVAAINDHFSRTGSDDSSLQRIEDTIRRTIRDCDVTVLFGTDPSVCMDVLEDHGLTDVILDSPGILVTLSEVSAAVCGEFENEALYDRSLRRGLGIMNGAHLCMHYDESEEQLRRMIRQLEIHGGSLLVLSEQSGVYLEDGHIELLGDAFIADDSDLEELYSLL